LKPNLQSGRRVPHRQHVWSRCHSVRWEKARAHRNLFAVGGGRWGQVRRWVGALRR